jgi:superfamily II DNA or RNA helicase
MKIEILDAVECKISKQDGQVLLPCLSFESSYWKQGPIRKTKCVYQRDVFSHKGKDGWYFYTGLLPRVRQWALDNKIPLKIVGSEIKIKRDNPPSLPGITFREDQLKMIDVACEKQRGIIKSPTGCLTGDTIININRAKKGGKIKLELMYQKWNGLKSLGKKWDKSIETYLRSYNGETINLNEVEDVIYSGMKKVYLLELANDKTLKATFNHRIMTKRGWVELCKLQKTDYIMIDVLIPKKAKGKKKKNWYPLYHNLWYHPFASTVKTKKEKRGYSKRVHKHIIVFEANLNNISVEDYVYQLKNNKNAPNIFEFINPNEFHIHHIDGNPQNYDISNLLKLTPIEHWQLHDKEMNYYTHFSQGVPEYSKFKSLALLGTEKTYDICCKKPHNNFVANGIVVHNSGKTIMQIGLMSCYSKARILLLAHSNDITSQTFKQLQKFGFKDSELFGGGNLITKPTKRIVVSTMQSFIKLPPEDYVTYFDIVLLDEAHHLQNMTGKDKDGKVSNTTYVEILSHMLAPIRIGWTATTRTNDEAVLVNESLLGPVIGQTTIEQAAELGILARPRLHFIKAKCSPAVMELRKYLEVYEFAVVRNQLRNRQIAKCAKEFYDKGETTLIFVTQIAHGELIAEEIKKILGIDVPFVQGSMPQAERNKVKNALIKKKIKLCIATTSWREGVDIPTLFAVILTGGGKSEVQTLQGVGRGLRKAEGKEFVTIVDILDLSHNHLLRQLGERLSTYSDMGWL